MEQSANLGHIMEIDLSELMPIQNEAFRHSAYKPKHLVSLRMSEVTTEESPQSPSSVFHQHPLPERQPSTDRSSRALMHSRGNQAIFDNVYSELKDAMPEMIVQSRSIPNKEEELNHLVYEQRRPKRLLEPRKQQMAQHIVAMKAH